MLPWITANLATIVPLLVIAALVGLIIARMIKNKKAGKFSCGSGCSGCAMNGACHPQETSGDSQG